MTLIFSWTSWEFWILALLLLLNLGKRNSQTLCDHSEILEKLEEIQNDLTPDMPNEF